MKVCMYPGSFDPITNGHLDIIKRGATIFDKIIVAILVNSDKKGLFSISERIDLIKKVTKDIENIEIISDSRMLIDIVEENKVDAILKGIRNSVDFEYEMQMAIINKKLKNSVETIFLPSDLQTSYISSSAVKQIVKLGGSIKDMVPDNIINEINNKILSK